MLELRHTNLTIMTTIIMALPVPWRELRSVDRAYMYRLLPQLCLSLLYHYFSVAIHDLSRAQWLRGRASDSRLREPRFESWLRC